MPTIEELYQSVLGRAPDPGGLEFWKSYMGSNVDPNEISAFINAAQAEKPGASYTAPTVSTSDIQNYLAANPNMTDAQIVSAMDQYGVTPEQIAVATGLPISQVQARYEAATSEPAAVPQADTAVTQIQPQNITLEQLYKDVLGRAPDPEGLRFWQSYMGSTIDPNEIEAFKAAAQAEKAGKSGATDQDIKNYIAQNINNPQAIADAAKTLGVTAEDIQRATGYTPTQQAGYFGQSGLNALQPINVEQLYKDILGRQADPGGLSYWQSQFGTDISPAEIEQFKKSAQPEILVNQAFKDIGFSNASTNNPKQFKYWSDKLQSGELTPEQFQDQFKKTVRAYVEQNPDTDVSKSIISKVGDVSQYAPNIVKTRFGDTNTDTLLNLARQIVPNLGELKGGIYSTKGESVGFGYDEATKILGHAPTSAEQVILDMARNLANQGITDLKQLQVKDFFEDVSIRPEYDEFGRATGKYLASIPSGDSEYTTRVLTAEEASKIKRSEYPGEEGYTYTANIPTQKALYASDKLLTKGALDTLNYSLGNTYSGPGMTGYNITINPLTGQPQFTTFGADTGQKALISSALTFASFIPGVAPFAQAANALWSIEQGNYLGAAATLASMGAGFSTPGSDEATLLSNVSTGFRAVDAIQRNDPLALAASLMSNKSIAGDIGGMKLGDTNITLSDAGNAAALIAAIQSGNVSAMMNAAMGLSRSLNSRTSDYGQRAMDGINSGDMSFAQDFSSEMADIIAASENLLTQDGLKQVTQTALNSQVSNSGYDDVNSAVYNAAIQSGMSQDQASGAADSVANVIQYPGGGVDTRGTENVQLASADTKTTDVTVRDVPAEETKYTIGQTIGDPDLRMTINENWQIVDADTGEPVLQDNGQPYTISPSDRATAGVAETPGGGTKVETYGVGLTESEPLQKSIANVWDKIKDIGSLFSSGTSDPTAEKFALFGSGASGGDPTETFALFAKDYPRDAIVFIENRVQEALSDPNVSDERKAEIVAAAEKTKLEIEKTIPKETPTTTVSGGGGGGGGLTSSSLQSMVEAGTAVQNPDQTVTITHDDGSTETFAPTGEQIASTSTQEPADISIQTPTDQTVTTIASSGTTADSGTTTKTGTTAETGGAGTTTEAGTTAESGTGGGTGGGEGTGAGTGTGEGSGTGTGTGEGGGTGTGYGTGTGTGTTTTTTTTNVPSTPTTPTTPTRQIIPSALATAREWELPKPREIPYTPDIKLFQDMMEFVKAPIPQSQPHLFALVKENIFDYFKEKQKKEEDIERRKQENLYYYGYEEAPQTAKEGGLIGHNPEFYSEGGTSVLANRYVRGRGDGTSDSVPAMLASGEFVIPADVVSNLGNGDNDAGAKTLDKFMEVIRTHKRSAPSNELPEDSKGPLAYLQEALVKSKGKKHGRTK